MLDGSPSRLRGDGMPVSKVVYGQQTLIDLTSDTVTPEALLKGYTAHRSDGSVVTGIMFEGYPQRLPVYEGVQDAEEKDLLDDAGNRIEGRIVYQRI